MFYSSYVHTLMCAQMKDNWRSALVDSQATMEIAAEVLTNSSMRIVLVVDKHDRLLGTVTDGDIRRALMGRHFHENSSRRDYAEKPDHREFRRR